MVAMNQGGGDDDAWAELGMSQRPQLQLERKPPPAKFVACLTSQHARGSTFQQRRDLSRQDVIVSCQIREVASVVLGLVLTWTGRVV